MKRIIKKNQLIITSLVIMIVVAGYLNFTADKSSTSVSGNQGQVASNKAEAADEMLVDVDVAPEEDMDIVNAAAEGSGAKEDTAADKAEAGAADGTGENASAGDGSDKDGSDMTGTGDGTEDGGEQTENIDDVGSIGEAVLTSSQAAKGFSAAAKLNREQVRSQNKEMLMEIINDSAGDAAAKEEAAGTLMALSETAEKEQAAETLLEAKGFKNSVVSITEDSVDVVICLESLDDTQRAQIEDIVKRKAGVGAESIVITTLNE